MLRADAGGFRNRRRWASKVVGLVGWIKTFEVRDPLYGTKMVRDPSFPRMPEFRRSKRRPWARSFARSRNQLYPPYPEPMIDKSSAMIAMRRVVFEVRWTLERNRSE